MITLVQSRSKKCIGSALNVLQEFNSKKHIGIQLSVKRQADTTRKGQELEYRVGWLGASIQYFRSPGSSYLREAEGGKASIARHFARRPTSFACIDDILPRDIFNDTEGAETEDLR